MFASANREFLARVTAATRPTLDPVKRLRLHTRVFLDFCVEDPVRYQLLFRRTISGFVPIAQSYAPAVAVLDDATLLRGQLRPGHHTLCAVPSPISVDLSGK